jgi:hypothetical protein
MGEMEEGKSRRKHRKEANENEYSAIISYSLNPEIGN